MYKKLIFLTFAALWFIVLTSFFNWIMPDEEISVREEINITPVHVESETAGSLGTETAENFLLDELDCLALNIYHESRGDSLAGQAAVADVVLNRVKESRYPDTVCGVVKQAVLVENWKGNIVPKRNQCQFSWFCDGLSDEPRDLDAWSEAYTLAEETMNGAWRGITEGSTHYHAAHMRAVWSNDRGMKYTGTIGQHEFYKFH